MAGKTPPINVWLDGVLGERFLALRNEFPALPSSTLIRALLEPQLSKPLADQIEIVFAGLRKPKGSTVGKNRLNLNSDRSKTEK